MTQHNDTHSPSSPLPPPRTPRPRNTVIAGYIISLVEDGARWANKIWAEYRSLQTSHRPRNHKPRLQEARRSGHPFQYPEPSHHDSVHQTKYGRWVNSWPETHGREIVRDTEIQLGEGEEDRRILEGLKEDGIIPIEFGCYFF